MDNVNKSGFIGVDAEIYNDPRVMDALGAVDRGIDKEASQIVTADNSDKLSKYGIKMRISGLNHKALIARIMYACPTSLKPKKDEDGKIVNDSLGKPIMESSPDMPSINQALIWLYTLAAPMSDVYGAIALVESNGIDPLIEKIDQWCELKDIGVDALPVIIAAMSEDMRLIEKTQLSSGNTTEKKTI